MAGNGEVVAGPVVLERIQSQIARRHRQTLLKRSLKLNHATPPAALGTMMRWPWRNVRRRDIARPSHLPLEVLGAGRVLGVPGELVEAGLHCFFSLYKRSECSWLHARHAPASLGQ